MPSPSRSGAHVQLVDPAILHGQHPDDPLALGRDPCLAPGHEDVADPAPDLVVRVGQREVVGRGERGEVDVRDAGRIVRVGPPDDELVARGQSRAAAARSRIQVARPAGRAGPAAGADPRGPEDVGQHVRLGLAGRDDEELVRGAERARGSG